MFNKKAQTAPAYAILLMIALGAIISTTDITDKIKEIIEGDILIFALSGQNGSLEQGETIDTIPLSELAFNDITDAEPGEIIFSEAIRVTEIPGGASISISDPDDNAFVSIQGQAGIKNGTLQNGEFIRLQTTTSDTFAESKTITLNIGTRSVKWNVTNREIDLNPDDLEFEDFLGASPGERIQSVEEVLQGFDGQITIFLADENGAPINLSLFPNLAEAPSIILNRGGESFSGAATPGDVISLVANAPQENGETLDLFVKIGDSLFKWTYGAKPLDDTPTAFGFLTRFDIPPGTEVVSESSSINDFEGEITASILNSIPDGFDQGGITSYSTEDTPQSFSVNDSQIKEGTFVTLKTTAPPGFDQKSLTEFTAGEVTATWEVRTSSDGPDAFVIPASLDVEPGQLITSNDIVPAGFLESVKISVEEDNATLVLAGFPSGKSSGSVALGDDFAVKAYAPLEKYDSETGEGEIEIPVVLSVPGAPEGTQKTAIWKIRTIPASPDIPEVNIISAAGLEPSAEVTSESTLSGFAGEITVSVNPLADGSPQIAIPGQSFTDSISVSANQVFLLRGIASDQFETSRDIVVSINGNANNWNLTTRKEDDPLPFCPPSLQSLYDIPQIGLTSQTFSGPVQITGFQGGPLELSLTGDISNAIMLVNGQPGNILNEGDNLAIDFLSPDQPEVLSEITVSAANIENCETSIKLTTRDAILPEIPFPSLVVNLPHHEIISPSAALTSFDGGNEVIATLQASGVPAEWAVDSGDGFDNFSTQGRVLKTGDLIKIKTVSAADNRSTIISIHALGFGIIGSLDIATDPRFDSSSNQNNGNPPAANKASDPQSPDTVTPQQCGLPAWDDFPDTKTSPLSYARSTIRTIPRDPCEPDRTYAVSVEGDVDALLAVNGGIVPAQTAEVISGDTVQFLIRANKEFSFKDSYGLLFEDQTATWNVITTDYQLPEISNVENLEAGELIDIGPLKLNSIPEGTTIQIAISTPPSGGALLSTDGQIFQASAFPITVTKNDQLFIRVSAPPSFDAQREYQLSTLIPQEADGASSVESFTLFTKTNDIPDPFDFSDLDEVEPGLDTETEEITLSGLSAATLATPQNAGLVVNNVFHGLNVPVQVSSGDSIRLRTNAPASPPFQITKTSTLLIGSQFLVDWEIQTRAERPATAVNDNIVRKPTASFDILHDKLLQNDLGIEGRITTVFPGENITPVLKENTIEIQANGNNGDSFSFDYLLETNDNSSRATVTVVFSDHNPCPGFFNETLNACIFDKAADSGSLFTAGPGMDEVTVHMWGAGGAGGGSNECSGPGGNGGAGAYLTGILEMNLAEEVTMIVGSGGQALNRGGKLTGIKSGSSFIAIAGSGGAGGPGDGINGNFPGGHGGAGGITNGQDGGNGSGPLQPESGGLGGSQSAGGSAVPAGAGIGRDGGFLAGANGPHNDGGDGFFGGSTTGHGTPGGGGGGSSLRPDGTWTGTNGNFEIPGNAGQISKWSANDNAKGGQGQCLGNDNLGGDGLIVIEF